MSATLWPVAVLGATGCPAGGSSDQPAAPSYPGKQATGRPSPTDGPTGAPTGPLLATYPPAEAPGGDSALLEGVLAIVGQCLVVRADDRVHLPIFPADQARYDPDTEVLRWGAGSTVRVGEPIALGGGEGGVDDLTARLGSPPLCTVDGGWTVAAV